MSAEAAAGDDRSELRDAFLWEQDLNVRPHGLSPPLMDAIAAHAAKSA